MSTVCQLVLGRLLWAEERSGAGQVTGKRAREMGTGWQVGRTPVNHHPCPYLMQTQEGTTSELWADTSPRVAKSKRGTELCGKNTRC